MSMNIKSPAIVSEELWEQANLEISKRRHDANGIGGALQGATREIPAEQEAVLRFL